MKTQRQQSMWTSIGLVAALGILSGCMEGAGPVPESWYRLPEEGQAKNPGSLTKLGSVVEQLLEAQSTAMEPISAGLNNSGMGFDQPVDWVPWHLAMVSSEFGITSDGLFGSLLFDGSASVTAKWIRPDSDEKFIQNENAALGATRQKRPDLLITGNATAAAVVQQLEPSIRAALSTGHIKNEKALRKNILAGAETFRHLAARLSSLELDDNQFQPSAFRLEIAVDSEGQLTAVAGVGAEVTFRLDWVINRNDNNTSRMTAVASRADTSNDRMGNGLEDFVRSIAPDLDFAAREAASISKSGYKLSRVRIGLGISSSYEFGIAESSASMMGSIVFGDNEEEGGCYDPDGDGDCHSKHKKHHSLRSALSAQNINRSPAASDGIRLIEVSPKPHHLGYANSLGVRLQALQSLNAAQTGSQDMPDSVVYTIQHDKFREGLQRALSMAGFFTQHASTAKLNSWKIKELETEFSLSLSGTMGLATVSGTGEVELEFENKAI